MTVCQDFLCSLCKKSVASRRRVSRACAALLSLRWSLRPPSYWLRRVLGEVPAKPGMCVRVCVCPVSRMDALVSHSRPLCMPVAVAREHPAPRSVTFNSFFFTSLLHCVHASSGAADLVDHFRGMSCLACADWLSW